MLYERWSLIVYLLIFSSTHWTTLLGRTEWLNCHCLHFDILKHTLDHIARKEWGTWLPLSTPVCKFQVYKGSSALFSSNRTKHVRVLLLCLCAGTGCDGPGIFTFAISCPWLIFERLVRVLWCMLWIFSVCFQHDNEICVFFQLNTPPCERPAL